MSNHFTYEIDERNLRIQLKELEVPVKEDAWQKFEIFSDAQVSHHTNSALRNFNLNLNRNVVLPVVFGVIIILFSFLLVNFISIKNPKKENAQKAEISPVIKPEPQPLENKTAAAPLKTVPEMQPDTKNNEALNVAEVKITKEGAVADIPAPVSPQPQQTEPQIAGTEVAAETTSTADVKSETPVKKKRKRRSAEVIESDQLPDIRPSLISEEHEEDIRPN